MTEDPDRCTRRQALTRIGGLLGTVAAVPTLSTILSSPARAHGQGEYRESALPYDWSALEGFLSAATLQEHYEKYQRTHIREANRLVKELAKARTVGDFSRVNSMSESLAFHASGHLLHNTYWRSVNPHASLEPSGDVRAHVEENFGSADALRNQLRAAAEQLDGEGWIVVAWDPMTGRLFVLPIESNHRLALQGAAPMIALDLWEHAYIADYGHRRADYVEKFLQKLDWDFLGLQLVRQH